MSAGKSIRQKKTEYIDRLISLLEEYPKILIVNCDNIGSAHMQKVRRNLRGKAVLLMGKNTMIRRAIRANIERNPDLNNLLPLIFGNVGLVFTKGDLGAIRDQVQTLRVPAAAKAGILAPKDVIVPKGMTTLEPTKTSFLHAFNIASKINRGQIEFLNDIHLIRKGDRVGSSESAFLHMLDVKPFEYGIVCVSFYDNGVTSDASILEKKNSDIMDKFVEGLANVAALSLGVSFPTAPAFPHVVFNAFKNLAAVAVETEYEFSQVKKFKEFVKNPSAFASAPVSAPPVTKEKEAPKPMDEWKFKDDDDDDEPVTFNLFD